MIIDHKEVSYNIPKAELHCHIEGTIQPELIVKLAKKHNIEGLKEKSVEDLQEMYKFNNLKQFLELYNFCVQGVIDEDDYDDLMFMYLEKSANQGMKYCEVFLDIQSIIYKGNSIMNGINGLHKGLLRAQKQYDIHANIIICFLRDSPYKDVCDAFDLVVKHKDKFIAIGLASNEYGYPPEIFKDIYELARKHDIRTVAHAGEECHIPCEYIYSCLDILKVDRIDHGAQIMKDKDLIEKVKIYQTPLTLCPVSNYKLKVFNELKDCPVRLFLDHGLNICLNSDDPGFFENFIGDTYYETGVCFNFTLEDYKIVSFNSFNSSFISDESKGKYLKEVEDYLLKFK